MTRSPGGRIAAELTTSTQTPESLEPGGRDYPDRATPSAAPVFLSYSRKDYYFAESLAFHLLRRNVPAWLDVKDLKPGQEWERDLDGALDAASTLLLVVSPHSIASERVHAEWQRARRRGCRIVLVRFRNAPVPPELASCEVVDFRGSFGRALRRLAARLDLEPADGAAGDAAPSRWPVLPLWVALMATILAVPVLGYFAAANWTVARDEEYRSLIQVLAPIAALAIAWFFCGAFMRRRMGMTRLALCLLCLATVFALPTLGYFTPRLSFLATDDVAALYSAYWRVGLVLLGVPIIGLCIVLLVRPEDLLRWTPTGKAWNIYRVGRVANAAFGRAELAFQFAQIGAFTLAFDPVDGPMARGLREQLVTLGGAAPSKSGESATTVLLLTNRTRLEWINGQSQQLGTKDVVTIVGTGIDLPPTLDWLWRRQWIDFRRWDVRRSERALALPQVPDAVTQARLPFPVARAQHVLCAVAALVFTLGGGLNPDGRSEADPSLRDVVGVATFLLGVWWGVIALWLVKRTRTAAMLSRAVRIGAAASVLMVGLDFYLLAGEKLAPWHMAMAALFLIGALAWLSRQSASLAFWLPNEHQVWAYRRMVLGTYRDWSTLVWFFAYALLWMWVLGFSE